MGPRGEKGERGEAVPTIASWYIDRERYRAIPFMTDGSPGPELNLRELFEQFRSKQLGTGHAPIDPVQRMYLMGYRRAKPQARREIKDTPDQFNNISLN
jgi:hypothetical protein